MAYAIENGLVPCGSVPPIVGYAMVVRLCVDSISPKQGTSTVCPMDSAFCGTSYFDRLVVLCRRLLGERLYQAVWVVGVDPDGGKVIEPDEGLT